MPASPGPFPKIRRVQLNRRQPPVAIEDLALMLEIDLTLGRRDDFRRRLQHALDDAARQGADSARHEKLAARQSSR